MLLLPLLITLLLGLMWCGGVNGQMHVNVTCITVAETSCGIEPTFSQWAACATALWQASSLNHNIMTVTVSAVASMPSACFGATQFRSLSFVLSLRDVGYVDNCGSSSSMQFVACGALQAIGSNATLVHQIPSCRSVSVSGLVPYASSPTPNCSPTSSSASTTVGWLVATTLMLVSCCATVGLTFRIHHRLQNALDKSKASLAAALSNATSSSPPAVRELRLEDDVVECEAAAAVTPLQQQQQQQDKKS